MDIAINKPKQTSLLKKLKRLWGLFLKFNDARKISKHFSRYFLIIDAQKPELKKVVYGIRHQVYCIEEQFEPANDNQQERDEFDAYSLHCVLQHLGSQSFAGTVRVVWPKQDNEVIPIERYCSDSITELEYHPSNFPKGSVCEISRLAVPFDFRRRQADKFDGSGTGVINESDYSEDELRCFPFIAIGLYLAAAGQVYNHRIPHTYVMMEPRLAKSMAFIGIKFKQIGPPVYYHGVRAPYYISHDVFFEHLSPSFNVMFDLIRNQLKVQSLG